ncbi:MAG: hypothetical protein KJO31_17340 [Gammaproteobacteria bacterium]|nr:hypothetical protein [Gammaproteobacteria bacterium]
MGARKHILLGLAVASVATLAVFDVDVNPRFSLPTETTIPDPAVEQAYESCRDDIRRRALQDAYEETDNPEVHSTLQRLAEAEAATLCRERHPIRRIPVSKPLDVNLIDLRYRY